MDKTLTKANVALLATGFLAILGGYTLMGASESETMRLTLSLLIILLGFIILLLGIWHPISFKRLLSDKAAYTQSIIGFTIFAFTFTIYLITLEPTASYWDCSEFIASAYKLQVPHPPGSPVFLLLGRVVSLMAFGNLEKVAILINSISAFSSALAATLLYQTMVQLFTRKDKSNWQLHAASIVGALTLAFSDSFWFSAVEAEIYAMGAFLIALILWLVVKMYKCQDKRCFERYLMTLSLVVGLSAATHPLALLTIPGAVTLVWLKDKKLTFKTIILGLLLGMVGLLSASHLFTIETLSIARVLDIFLVNSVGMPFWSGLIVSLTLLYAASYLVIRLFRLNISIYTLVAMCISMILIGFSPYTITVIRSNQHPVINQHEPGDLNSLVSYLKRESYPGRPLLYGQYFDAQIVDFESEGKIFEKTEDRYKEIGHRTAYKYDPKRSTFAPRMYSNDPQHVASYMEWTDMKKDQKPGFKQNLIYMFRNQLNHMYFRYLMFNFSGRGGDRLNAEWLGIGHLLRHIPNTIKKNKAWNEYYMIPFIIGLFGAFMLYRDDKKAFITIMTLFLFTGPLLNFYLNPPPIEPRERDYIYVGSFIAFSVFISYGIYGLIQNWLRKTFLAIPTLLAIPSLLLMVNYDDHDRSGRYYQVDQAINTLNALPQNAILFTGGDNDTFPLWYAQEVDNIRTDVRVIVLSYFNSDWNIHQMTMPANDAPPLPISLEYKHYAQYGKNDYLPLKVNPKIKDAIDVGQFIQLIKEEHPVLSMKSYSGEPYNIIPAKSMTLKYELSQTEIDTLLSPSLRDLYSDRIVFSLKGKGLEKNALILLDILNENNWERPVYFNGTSLSGVGFDFTKNVVREGNVFRLLPIQNGKTEIPIDTRKMFENLMVKSHYRGLGKKNVYYDTENHLLRGIYQLRENYDALIRALLLEGQIEKAKEVMNKSLSLINTDYIQPNYYWITTIQLLDAMKMNEESEKLKNQMLEIAGDEMTYGPTAIPQYERLAYQYILNNYTP